MNPTARSVVVWMGIAAVKVVLCGTGAVRLRAAEEERPPIFAEKGEAENEAEADVARKRMPLLSATAKRRIAEQVLADVRADAEAEQGRSVAAEKSSTDLSPEGDVVVLERYVVRELRGPELTAPKNRALEMIRTGRLFTNPAGNKTLDLLGSSVWNSSVGDTGDAKLTLKFTIRW